MRDDAVTDPVHRFGQLLTAEVERYVDQAEGEEVAPELVHLVIERGAALAPWIDALSPTPAGRSWDEAPAGKLAAAVIRAVERRQQFATIEPALAERLEAIFRVSLAELAARLRVGDAELEQAWRGILQRQRALVRGELVPDRPVVCAQYTPELQLELLGVTFDDLRPPLLDIGCGERAELVARCRARGIEAVGLDRHGGGQDVIEADWLDYALPPMAFGTIVSHQAFSLHFLHQHLAAGGLAETYARKYMQILRALRVGASFIYVPGLPFIEAHLETPWSVTRTPLPSPLREAVSAVFASRVGEDVAYSCRVTRGLAGAPRRSLVFV